MWLFLVIAISFISLDSFGFALNDNLTDVLYFESESEDDKYENIDECLDIKSNIEDLEKDIETSNQVQEGTNKVKSLEDSENIEISEQEVLDILNSIRGG